MPYVLCRGKRVVGYYALTMSSVAHASARGRLRCGLPDQVPVVLLARLVLDRSDANGPRRDLLIEGLRRCVRGGREFDSRRVADAMDEDAAEFYVPIEFHDLDGQRLWRRISDVDRALAA